MPVYIFKSMHYLAILKYLPKNSGGEQSSLACLPKDRTLAVFSEKGACNFLFNQVIEFSWEVLCGHQIASVLGGDYEMPVFIQGDWFFWKNCVFWRPEGPWEWALETPSIHAWHLYSALRFTESTHTLYHLWSLKDPGRGKLFLLGMGKELLIVPLDLRGNWGTEGLIASDGGPGL